MAKDRLFDFILRQEPRPGRNPPYVVRAHVVVSQIYETRGFKKHYMALTDVIENLEDADAVIKLLMKETYALRKKIHDEFDAVERARKKAVAAAEEAEAEAKKRRG